MAKDPAFLFYYQDFLVGTSFMTDEEIGCYVKILCHMADKKSLTKDQIIKLLNGKEFNGQIRGKFLQDKHGNFYQKRLRDEVIKRKNYVKSRRNNRLGKKQTNNICKSYDAHMENENENENENVNTIKEFNRIYEKYPKKVGKKGALRHFRASVRNENDLKDIWIALNNYVASERVYKGFVQNASTWFNNWQDWVDFKETICQKCKGKGKYISKTGYEIKCDCPAGKK